MLPESICSSEVRVVGQDENEGCIQLRQGEAFSVQRCKRSQIEGCIQLRVPEWLQGKGLRGRKLKGAYSGVCDSGCRVQV